MTVGVPEAGAVAGIAGGCFFRELMIVVFLLC